MRSRLVTVLAFLLLLSSLANAATFTVSGTTLQVNLTAANDSVAITAGATNYTFAITTTFPLAKDSPSLTLAA